MGWSFSGGMQSSRGMQWLSSSGDKLCLCEFGVVSLMMCGFKMRLLMGSRGSPFTLPSALLPTLSNLRLVRPSLVARSLGVVGRAIWNKEILDFLDLIFSLRSGGGSSTESRIGANFVRRAPVFPHVHLRIRSW